MRAHQINELNRSVRSLERGGPGSAIHRDSGASRADQPAAMLGFVVDAIRTKTFYAFVGAVPADVVRARHRRIEVALNSPWVTHY